MEGDLVDDEDGEVDIGIGIIRRPAGNDGSKKVYPRSVVGEECIIEGRTRMTKDACPITTSMKVPRQC